MYLNKIKLFLVISICLIFFFLTYNDVKSKEPKIISGIAKVIDGDTLRIKGNKIRLYGIDAPESKQLCQKTWLSISFLSFNRDYPCGAISTKKLRNKINNKNPYLKCLKKAIETLRNQFDFIIIDCSPSLGYLTLNSFVAGWVYPYTRSV